VISCHFTLYQKPSQWSNIPHCQRKKEIYWHRQPAVVRMKRGWNVMNMYTITSMLLPTYNNREQQYLFNSHLQCSILWHPKVLPMNSRTHTDSKTHDKILLARTQQKNLVADSSETEESKSQSQLHDKYRANGIQWIMYASDNQYPRRQQDTV
jgi:hypothetical protein